jgi:hypothetical protein
VSESAVAVEDRAAALRWTAWQAEARAGDRQRESNLRWLGAVVLVALAVWGYITAF